VAKAGLESNLSFKVSGTILAMPVKLGNKVAKGDLIAELDPSDYLPRAVVVSAEKRFRPILLTTVTTIAGLLPLWLGGGPMWEPMVVAIIFGLLFATILTLGVVPVLYSLFYRVSFRDFKY
jgi:Cu/Ag efflux pump CusA